ncbi:inositol oxygenase-like [Daktulosphaira vitifoliae]|uniref:inositol oxygenase-like n=1 Tax=Daktulosphaira vitifoliae TaxID=58002 RepID=UPI0021AACB62|nr:inositol oxygenase-like [Daktulosphaira vitifoliae]
MNVYILLGFIVCCIYSIHASNQNIQDMRKQLYYDINSKHTVELAKELKDKWCKFNTYNFTIMEALDIIDTVNDASAFADISNHNKMHAYQVAECLRKNHPREDWLHLVGLIHDLGKVMLLSGEEPWKVVGNTFPVGCPFSTHIVYPEALQDNPDANNVLYNTKPGMYENNIGLDKVLMSWSHDEYLYHVLMNHKQSNIPKEGLFAIRYHSCAPLHSYTDYDYLCTQEDLDMKYWIQQLNLCDKFDKHSEINIDDIQPYYETLVQKYVPENLEW